MSGEVILNVEIVKKSLGGQCSAPNPAGELTVLPRPPSWWGLLRPPQEPHPALGLRPRFSVLSQQSSFPQCVFVRVLIKTLVVSIFGAKECIKMQDFVLNIQKKSGGRDPRTPSAGGETFVRTYPVPTRQMMVPLRFFWAGYGPAQSQGCGPQIPPNFWTPPTHAQTV